MRDCVGGGGPLHPALCSSDGRANTVRPGNWEKKKQPLSPSSPAGESQQKAIIGTGERTVGGSGWVGGAAGRGCGNKRQKADLLPVSGDRRLPLSMIVRGVGFLRGSISQPPSLASETSPSAVEPFAESKNSNYLFRARTGAKRRQSRRRERASASSVRSPAPLFWRFALVFFPPNSEQ